MRNLPANQPFFCKKIKNVKINRKLALTFIMLYVLVPAMLIFPLYERVEEVENIEKQKLIEATTTEDTSRKTTCSKSVKKTEIDRVLWCLES